jgi:hypothetical protein
MANTTVWAYGPLLSRAVLWGWLRGALLASACLLSLELNVSAQAVVRGPYLQSGTPTRVVVRWRTEADINGRVNYGTNLDDFGSDVTSAATVRMSPVAAVITK